MAKSDLPQTFQHKSADNAVRDRRNRGIQEAYRASRDFVEARLFDLMGPIPSGSSVEAHNQAWTELVAALGENIAQVIPACAEIVQKYVQTGDSKDGNKRTEERR